MATIIVGIILCGIVALILRNMYKNKKAGKSIHCSCGGNCSNCGSNCHH